MKIKILRIYEKDGLLRIETECEFGKDNLGLSLDAKYKDRDGEYKWMKEIKPLLNKKYGSKIPEKEVFEEFKDQEMTI
jgi:hypothetical protein